MHKFMAVMITEGKVEFWEMPPSLHNPVYIELKKLGRTDLAEGYVEVIITP